MRHRGVAAQQVSASAAHHAAEQVDSERIPGSSLHTRVCTDARTRVSIASVCCGAPAPYVHCDGKIFREHRLAAAGAPLQCMHSAVLA